MSKSPFWTCQCGAVNRNGQSLCEACGEHRSAEQSHAEGTVVKRCSDCGDTFSLWISLTPGEDSRLRCGPCHVEYLKRRAESASETIQASIEALKSVQRLIDKAIVSPEPREPGLRLIPGGKKT